VLNQRVDRSDYVEINSVYMRKGKEIIYYLSFCLQINIPRYNKDVTEYYGYNRKVYI